MKYNPELKPDSLSRAALILWLMQQSPEGVYSFYNPINCMLGKWVRSIDQQAMPETVSHYCYHVNGEIVNLSHFADIARNGDWTFGAALQRAMA